MKKADDKSAFTLCINNHPEWSVRTVSKDAAYAMTYAADTHGQLSKLTIQTTSVQSTVHP